MQERDIQEKDLIQKVEEAAYKGAFDGAKKSSRGLFGNFLKILLMGIVIIVFLSIVVRYLFASGGAYVAAMVPVFATVGLVTGTAPALLALAILFSNSYGGCITHYGGAAGPIIFAAGYNDIKSWWLTGTIIALLTFLLHMVVGIPWWGFLIQHGIL